MLRPALIITVAAALLCAACSDDSGDSGGDGFGLADGTGLRAALGRVAANDKNRHYVEYGDLSVLGKLVAGDGDRYRALLGYGFSPISVSYKLMAEELKFDPTKMGGAVLAGEPPDQSGLLWGNYDLDAVENALTEREIRSEENAGGKRWTTAGDHELNFDGPLVDIVPTAVLNDIHTADDTFGYSSTRAGLDSVVEPGDETLADDPLLGRLAGCLGDVSAAILVTEAEGDPMSYAVGVRTADGADTEVACVAPPDGEAKALRGRVEGELKDGSVPSTREPWAELLPKAKVELVEDESIVRIEATPKADAPVGRVMQMLQKRDLPALAGAAQPR